MCQLPACHLSTGVQIPITVSEAGEGLLRDFSPPSASGTRSSAFPAGQSWIPVAIGGLHPGQPFSYGMLCCFLTGAQKGFEAEEGLTASLKASKSYL